jgi:hypothetical protein
VSTKVLKLRRFNLLGLHEVERQLALSRTGQITDFPSLLANEHYTEVISDSEDIHVTDFTNRWYAGKYMHDLIERKRSQIGLDPETDRGLWTWLAIAWRDYLRKRGSKPNAEWDDERWLLSNRYNRYYKHLLAGPWLVYRRYSSNPELCKVLLLPPITSPGHEISEHFLCKYELANSEEIVAVVSQLYMLADGSGYKKGVSTGRGSIRRFMDFAGQIELTYDLMSLKRERILELLPTEFNRFR